jgi:hypothetical protein
MFHTYSECCDIAVRQRVEDQGQHRPGVLNFLDLLLNVELLLGTVHNLTARCTATASPSANTGKPNTPWTMHMREHIA